MSVFLNRKGQNIGTLKDGIFRKRVSQKKHLMKIYDAWGLDRSVYEQLKEAKEIRILDVDTNTVYSTTPQMFSENGIMGHFDGEQVFLSRKYFTQEQLKK